MLTPLATILLGAALGLLMALVAIYQHRARAHTAFAPTAAALQTLAAQIGALLAQPAYIRDAHRQHLTDKARSALAQTQTLRWLLFASSTHRAAAAPVARFAAHANALVAQANEAFIAAELAAYRDLFDTVESKPLTPAQRRACVSGEANNLVLAGAGTGKTSTIIGRAGYLLAAERMRADQLLMLAFAKKASGEMQERLNSRLAPWLQNKTPTIKTFHALGLEIIGAAQGRRPTLSPLAEDSQRFAQFIEAQIASCCEDAAYVAKILRYHGSERYPYSNPFDFASLQEYDAYVRTNELRTLKGEPVHSFEAYVIANLLRAHGITYAYRRPYAIETSGPDFRRYRPDFYLPDYGIYIEHFALDRKGKPPSHFKRKAYLKEVSWRRALHRKHGTKLIETYAYLKREASLTSYLADSLRAAGVVLRSKSHAEQLEELRKAGEIAAFSVLLADFVSIFKQADHELAALRSLAAQQTDAPRLLLLLDLCAPVLAAYEAELSASGQIDFADMIRTATRHVESGRFVSPYRQIMVDEFQDISRARARLIGALIKQSPEAVLFVVGDDWQSIYRFTGSDIAYTREFEGRFGASAITPLDTTFRFNDQIGQAAAKFVLKNPAQIIKSMKSITTTPHPAISMIRAVSAEQAIGLALDAIAKHASGRKSTVLLLGRYNFVVEEWGRPAARHRFEALYPSLDIDCMTVHAAKGKEADYVVVLELSRGKHGFPSERPTDAILQLLLPAMEPFPQAEERRLFYVALTRARHRVYLAYNPMDASSFVVELLDRKDGYLICTDECDERLMSTAIAHVPCPQCGAGALVPKTGPRGTFIGCNSFPYCTYKDEPCPQCGGLMRRQGSSRTCVNPVCRAVAPICAQCGGAMVERNGPHGRFWGCINYRTDAEFVCTQTISMTGRGWPRAGR